MLLKFEEKLYSIKNWYVNVSLAKANRLKVYSANFNLIGKAEVKRQLIKHVDRTSKQDSLQAGGFRPFYCYHLIVNFAV